MKHLFSRSVLFSLIQLGILLCALTFALSAQTISSSTRDALQDERILRLMDEQVHSSTRIDELATALNTLNESVIQAKGAVIGFGLALSALQVIHTVVAWKKGRG